MEPALTGNDGVTFSFQSGDVTVVKSNITCDLDHESLGGMDASKAMLYDMMGVKKVITVSGSLTTATSSRTNTGSTLTIEEQRQWLEKQFDGFQQGTEFESNHTSTYNGSTFANSRIMKAALEFTEEQNKPSELPFTLVLFVGDV